MQPNAAKNNLSGKADFLFTQAVGHHQAGRLVQAERLYREILAFDARHAHTLHILGILACQRGDLALAVEMIGEAISQNDGVAAFHSDLGIALKSLGKMELALASYERALAIKPDNVETLYNLGILLQIQGKPGDAVVRYEQALALRPNFPEALANIGIALQNQGKLEEAVVCYEQALVLRPDFPEVLSNLGNVLQGQGRLEEAVVCYEQAVALRPDFPEALDNIGIAYFAQGKLDHAMNAALAAIRANESQASRMLFCQCLKYLDPEADNSDNLSAIYGLAVRAVTETWTRPKDLADPCLSLVTSNKALKRLVRQAMVLWPGRLPEPVEPGIWETIADDRLLLSLLESTPISNVGFERFLTSARLAMLDFATRRSLAVNNEILVSFCAIARQCFINEYVFALLPAELERAGQLRDGVAAAISAGTPVAPLSLLAVAAYFPLRSLPGSESLLQQEWPALVREVLRQQIEEPKEEARLQGTIGRLTPIEDQISSAVRAQYEKNPFPRWVRAPHPPEMASIDAFLHREFPLAAFRNLGKSGGIDVLVAGCGTGQHSIGTAQRFPRARILAIDLSLSSLSYAKRKTEELGLKNVEYAQADILKLGTLDRSFDLIESVGTLMCLKEPIAGWRLLVSLLRPGGFMRIGLYSELARRSVVSGRNYIAEKGYQGDREEDIRQCRQEIMSMEGGATIAQLLTLGDFYTMSECRDLIFHVQEHRHTIPQIKENLKELCLNFIGFSLEPGVVRRYGMRFPEDRSRADLDSWDIFERENPNIFTGMYQFWVQKP